MQTRMDGRSGRYGVSTHHCYPGAKRFLQVHVVGYDSSLNSAARGVHPVAFSYTNTSFSSLFSIVYFISWHVRRSFVREVPASGLGLNHAVPTTSILHEPSKVTLRRGSAWRYAL